jgi:hypothetical protein
MLQERAAIFAGETAGSPPAPRGFWALKKGWGEPDLADGNSFFFSKLVPTFDIPSAQTRSIMRQPLISAISVMVLCLLLTSARSGEVVEATVCDIEKYGQCGSVYLKAGCHVSRDAWRTCTWHVAYTMQQGCAGSWGRGVQRLPRQIGLSPRSELQCCADAGHHSRGASVQRER